MYGPLPDEKFPVPAADVSQGQPEVLPADRAVRDQGGPGTIIVDPSNYFVYRIEEGGNATRYGANVGREGFLWSGDAYIGRKAEWPIWTPPKEMIKRQPKAAKYAGGMPPGLDNPLGARTLYLYQNGAYTLYTIYSTILPETDRERHHERLRRSLTQDMLHLYNQTPVKTKVVVLPA